MFSLLSVYLLSLFFCAHSCPCLGQTAVASVCISPGWAAALFVWLLPLAAAAWITLAFQSTRWRAWKESPVLSHFPSKETSWQGRWSFGSLPWFLQFSNPLFSNPSASSLHQPVNDRKWAGPCKPAVPWQLLDGVLDLWGQSHCWEFWSRIYMSDVSLPSSRKVSCEIQQTFAA